MNQVLLTASFIALSSVTTLAGCTSQAKVAPAPPPAPFRFRDVAAEVGFDFRFSHEGKSPLNILETGGIGGGFVDLDNDHWLDIVISAPNGCHVYRNVQGRFQKIADAAGLPQSGHWQGVAAGDWDNDGWIDLFLTGFHDQRLLRNEHGRFRDVTAAAGLTDREHWNTSAAFLDYDRDGHLDLFICRYLQFGPKARQLCSEHGIQTACAPAVYPAERSLLYRNLGKGRFTPVHAKTFAASAGKSWAVLPFDYNDDGWPDLFVANDTEPADLWLNNRGRGFRNVGFDTGTALSPLGRAYGGMGITAADVDRDGKQDFFLASFTDEPKSLFKNLGGESGFQDVSDAWGLGIMRGQVTWGCTLADFDSDGWPDLATVSGHIMDNYQQIEPTSPYAQPTNFFHNQSGRSFQPITAARVGALEEPIVGRTLASGDYDNDGRIDLLVLNLEGSAALLHNTTPLENHSWLGLHLEGSTSNRQAFGARVILRDGERIWTTEVQSAGSVFSCRDSRLLLGLGSTLRIQGLSVRWPSGQVQEIQGPTLNRYLTVREKKTN